MIRTLLTTTLLNFDFNQKMYLKTTLLNYESDILCSKRQENVLILYEQQNN